MGSSMKTNKNLSSNPCQGLSPWVHHSRYQLTMVRRWRSIISIIRPWSGVGGQLLTSSSHENTERKHREKTQRGKNTERKKHREAKTQRENTERKHTENTERKHRQKYDTILQSTTQYDSILQSTTCYASVLHSATQYLHVGAGNRAQDLLLPRLTPYPRGKFSGTTIFKRLW